MMIAWVALRPKVTGKRMDMPASGPLPGSTPTSVPTRPTRNAYQTFARCSAAGKSRYMLWRVVSTILESERACFERRLEDVDKQNISRHDDSEAVNSRGQEWASLDDREQRENQQHVGGEESKRFEQRNRRGCDCDDQSGVL